MQPRSILRCTRSPALEPAPARAAGASLAAITRCTLVCGRRSIAAPAASAAARPPNLNQFERQERAAGLGRENAVKIVRIGYVAHDGSVRRAYVILPRWYGPGDDPPIPLIISPHGRGIRALANASLWGNLPAVGRFAVVCPEGQGRRLTLFAWGDPGDIADLARMPTIVANALPFLHIDRHRVYAFGSSMGGQETLLLLVARPRACSPARLPSTPTPTSLPATG